MGFRDVIHGCPGGGYQRLQSQNEHTANPGGQIRRKVNGKVVALRLSSSKKLKWGCSSSAALARRVVDLCGEITSTMKLDEASCPTIVFSSQWGLPVLSHPSSVGSKRVIYLHK